MLLLNKILDHNIINYDGNSGLAFQAGLIFLFVLTLCSYSGAQWNNNPQINKALVSNLRNPYNISAAGDLKGGGFIFWEDKIDSLHTNIFFQHFDEDGNQEFRSDGKEISKNSSSKSFPISCTSLSGSAAVVYKDFINDKMGELYAQRVSGKGELQWGEGGIRLTDHQGESLDPSVTSDSYGNIFLVYIYRDYSTPANYLVYLQKLTPSGKTLFRENGILIQKSLSIKSKPQIAADDRGGAYVFWIESNEGKARIYSQHIDSDGKNTWGLRPELVSSPTENVLHYSVQSLSKTAVYVNWEVKRTGKNILHQLISLEGRSLWTRNGERVTTQYGDQTNPQSFCTDSTIIVTWVNETLGDKDIYIQKFNLKGKPAWNKDGVPVIKVRGTQMSQRVITDRSSGAIVAWLDKRTKTQKVNILAQRINGDGKRMWDSTGVELASNQNSEKSYLMLLPNKSSGAVAVFKEIRNNEKNIFGQRILGNGKYIFEINGFKAIVDNNIVRASWQTINESGNKGFSVERSIDSDTAWRSIRFVPGKNQKGINAYEFSENLPSTATVYYRLVQIDEDNNSQKSSKIKLDYFDFNSTSFTLAQNFPNPFSDSTVIKYYLPERCKVTLEIYNDKIETITVPVDDFQEKGEYSVPFYAHGSYGKLPGGVYFYRLKAGEFVEVKKMIIAR